MQYASNRNRVRAPMRRQALLLLAVLALAGSSVADEAGGLYVICHPSVTLSASDLRDVFLGEKQFAGSVRLAPADNSAARDAFLEGTWDATALLLDRFEEVEIVARRLPYVSGF